MFSKFYSKHQQHQGGPPECTCELTHTRFGLDATLPLLTLGYDSETHNVWYSIEL